MNGCKLNAVMDTGAGVSVIDYGSLEHIGLHNKIRMRKDDDNGLINASGNEMDIVGVVDIPVIMRNRKPVMQEFKVLNSKSYSIDHFHLCHVCRVKD